jgi:hypothetical protein
MSIGDRAGSLPAELSIDWNTPAMVLASFLRLVTSPKIFKRPTPIGEAIGFVDALLTLPGVQLADVGARRARLGAAATHRPFSCARGDVDQY